jgi:hypothetical protein
MKSQRPERTADTTKAAVEEIPGIMHTQGKRQFGEAVKSFWFYEDDLCPGCMARPIGTVKIKGREGLPVNAFIHHPGGVLIGYFLCGICARFIHSEAAKTLSNKLLYMLISKGI